MHKDVKRSHLAAQRASACLHLEITAGPQQLPDLTGTVCSTIRPGKLVQPQREATCLDRLTARRDDVLLVLDSQGHRPSLRICYSTKRRGCLDPPNSDRLLLPRLSPSSHADVKALVPGDLHVPRMMTTFLDSRLVAARDPTGLLRNSTEMCFVTESLAWVVTRRCSVSADQIHPALAWPVVGTNSPPWTESLWH